MSLATLNDIFFAAVERNLDRMLLHREGGQWLPISSREFGRSVSRTSPTVLPRLTINQRAFTLG